MSKPRELAEKVPIEIAAQASAVAALAERVILAGEGFLPQERRQQLKEIRDALIDNQRIMEAAAQEAESVHAVLMAAPQDRARAGWNARHVPSSDEIARANAAIQQRLNSAVLAELVRQSEERQAAATNLASSLLASEPQLTEVAPGQSELVRHSVELLAQRLSDRDAVLAWLNTEHRALGHRTPMHVIREGHADAVETLLANAADGIPA
jgi:hypothetical protein